MEFNTLTRYLVHGISIDLNNLYELLYFDALTCSDEKLIILNNIGNKKNLTKLIEKGLIVPRKNLLSEEDLNYFDTIHPPFGTTKFVARTFPQQDAINRDFAELARRKGKWAVPKFFYPNYKALYSNAKDEVLSILFSQFPKMQITENNFDNFIDFITDDETIEKKRKLFLWQNRIERRLIEGSVNIEEIYEIIESDLESYITWLNKHIEHFKYKVIWQGIFEIVSGILISLVIDKALIGVPLALGNGLLTFKNNAIELKEEEKIAPGNELAYIVHLQRKLNKS